MIGRWTRGAFSTAEVPGTVPSQELPDGTRIEGHQDLRQNSDKASTGAPATVTVQTIDTTPPARLVRT